VLLDLAQVIKDLRHGLWVLRKRLWIQALLDGPGAFLRVVTLKDEIVRPGEGVFVAFRGVVSARDLVAVELPPLLSFVPTIRTSYGLFRVFTRLYSRLEAEIATVIPSIRHVE
jgi:hypothetical protein